MGTFLGSILLIISMLSGCSSFLDGSSSQENKDVEYGSLSLVSSDRALNLSDISSAVITVTSSDISETISKTVSSVSNGTVSGISISNIPVGNNRIVTVEAKDSSSNSIKGFVLRAMVDIKAGDNNSVYVTWDTTGLANVYAKLLSAGKLIASYSDVQDSSILNAVPVAKGYYVDSDSIATDFIAGSLKTSSSYLLTSGTLLLTAYNASGYVVTVSDPISASKTISSDGSYSITDIAPGNWTVTVMNGSETVSSKSIVIVSGKETSLGTVGDPLKGKVIIFIKSSSTPTLWAWGENGNNDVKITENMGATWPGKQMTSALSTYMNDASGWYMLEITNYYSGTYPISMCINGGFDIVSDKTATFWYDGTIFSDTDPTENTLSDDTSLSSLTVNNTSISISSTTYEIENTVEAALVTAIATDSAASVSVNPSVKTSIAAGSTQVFTVTVTAENGTTKNYSLTVSRANAEQPGDVTLKTLKVNNSSIALVSGKTAYTSSLSGSADSLGVTVTATATSNNAQISVNPSVETTISDGNNNKFTITVTNSSNTATYTVTVDYKKVESSQYYWTNKNGAVGTNKTISSWSDWTSAEQIAQCAAYDDPRTWKGIQEVPYDVYALYAAYDDTNLYVMVELTNIADDSIFMTHNYAGSDNAWWDNRDIPLGMIFNTGSNLTTKPTIVAEQKPIWGSIDFSDSNGFNYLLYHSSKYGYAEHKSSFVGVGTPGFFKADSTGFNYTKDVGCFSVNSGAPGSEVTGSSGVSIRYNRGCAVSGSNIYYESTPTDNRATSEQTGQTLLTSNTYSKVSSSHDTDLDMSYWYTVPLSTIGMTKATIESKGIGIRQLTTNGGSLMDCSPWDVSMVDNATEECSDDNSTSKEKEDVDNITSSQARVGHM